jgi:uncharacterized protein YndB with AHSA1/START domain
MATIIEEMFERTYDASPKIVWQVRTDPELLKQWWEPNNVTVPECDVDLRNRWENE